MKYDVAIVGGGPGGSTLASFLKKYEPACKVIILERAKFPRDHVGESQLPPISTILEEIGVWDQVEAANFPIKIGASYRWGKNPEIWDFEFFPRKEFIDEPRPAKFEGQRKWTAFQVDRAIYDDILLNHAETLGSEVRQETRVVKVLCDQDRVEGLVLDSGETITADYYVDASGHSGIIRRALGVKTTEPTALQNIAIWDYWQNAEWAEEVGVGGTFVQVLSLGYGWFWFIPLGPTRTSIGFITSAEYFRRSGLRPEELYRRAMSEEPLIARLTKNATAEGDLQTTKDWSFVSERLTGENWFLVGESSGFADPILAAGLSLTHTAAREAAFTILELRRAEQDSIWLKTQYERGQIKRLQSHIRFADYWYSANAQFEDLKEFTQTIAESNGLDLSPDKAWAWLAQGGFIDEARVLGVGGYSLDQIKELGNHLSDLKPTINIDNLTIFRLDLLGTKKTERAVYADGKVSRCPCYERDGKVLPVIGCIDLVVHLLSQASHRHVISDGLRRIATIYTNNEVFVKHVLMAFEVTLEAMISDGWVRGYEEPSVPYRSFPNFKTALTWLSEPEAVTP